MSSLPESGARFMAQQIERLRRMPKKKIVFPEGDDERVLEAAARLAKEDLLVPVLIGKPPAQAPAGVVFVDPCSSPETRKYADIFYHRRRAKGITQTEAAKMAANRLYYAALSVTAGDTDAMVGSCFYTTADYVRAVLHCMEMRTQIRRVSSVHFLAVQDSSQGHQGLFAFSDAAIIPDPSPVELAEIAISTAASVRAVLDTEPLVAMLSFSTKGSAQHKLVNKVVEAIRYVNARAPEMQVDGELQADAALSAFVGQKKSPGSRVAGYANTLIFPDLNSANIGYKLVERLGGAALLAVLLQGIKKPANVISRGCTALDAYNTAIVSAVQAEGLRGAGA